MSDLSDISGKGAHTPKKGGGLFPHPDKPYSKTCTGHYALLTNVTTL